MFIMKLFVGLFGMNIFVRSIVTVISKIQNSKLMSARTEIYCAEHTEDTFMFIVIITFRAWSRDSFLFKEEKHHN